MKTLANNNKRSPQYYKRDWCDETGIYTYELCEDQNTHNFFIKLNPGEAVRVPSRYETYHQCAMRTGQFNNAKQSRLES